MRVVHLIAAATAFAPAVASAAETLTYHYDPKGRLVASERLAGPHDAKSTCYSFDRADNRTKQIAAGPHKVIWLQNGESLYPCDGVLSDDNRFVLLFQADGRLTITRRDGVVLWNIGPFPGATELRMQSDGNLVLYAGSMALWTTETVGNPGAHLAMQTDGNLVIYSLSGPAVWATYTFG